MWATPELPSHRNCGIINMSTIAQACGSVWYRNRWFIHLFTQWFTLTDSGSYWQFKWSPGLLIPTLHFQELSPCLKILLLRSRKMVLCDYLEGWEGNGNPLQCSCLENPRDGGAWWAAVCGVDAAEATWQQQQQMGEMAGVVQRGLRGDICIHTADSGCCTAESNTTL